MDTLLVNNTELLKAQDIIQMLAHRHNTLQTRKCPHCHQIRIRHSRSPALVHDSTRHRQLYTWYRHLRFCLVRYNLCWTDNRPVLQWTLGIACVYLLAVCKIIEQITHFLIHHITRIKITLFCQSIASLASQRRSSIKALHHKHHKHHKDVLLSKHYIISITLHRITSHYIAWHHIA